jgi:hypothetical protein
MMLAQHVANAQLAAEHDFSTQGYPGKQFVIDIDDKREQDKWLVVKKRVYRAVAVTPRDEANLKDVERFLDSFQVCLETVGGDS